MIRFVPRAGPVMALRTPNRRGGHDVIHPLGFGENWDRLAELQRSAQAVLAGLDDLGLHQAAAYVSMALDAMSRSRPDLLRTG
jgi:hypothetical protein